jgi:hypothetical protein
MTNDLGPKTMAFRIGLGALVVLLGIAAVVGALAITLNHFPVQPATATQAGSDRSAAVVAILTPVVAAIAAIVGLYFGISATGSARGRQAEAGADVARSASEAARSANETARTAVEIARSATGTPPATGS